MEHVNDETRAKAVESLMRSSHPGRFWFAFPAIAAALGGPVLLVIAINESSLRLGALGGFLAITGAVWVGYIFGQFLGSLRVATVAVDHLIAHSERPLVAAMLNALLCPAFGRSPEGPQT